MIQLPRDFLKLLQIPDKYYIHIACNADMFIQRALTADETYVQLKCV